MDSPTQLIFDHAAALLRRMNEKLESDCATAMMLQDYDKLDRLQTIWFPNSPVFIPPAVASEWWPDA